MPDNADSEFFTDADLPHADPEAVAEARSNVMARHVLATLRAERGMTLNEVAAERGVTKAAIHQIENKALGNLRISSMLNYLRGLGYDVDEDWLATSLCDALPTLDPA